MVKMMKFHKHRRTSKESGPLKSSTLIDVFFAYLLNVVLFNIYIDIIIRRKVCIQLYNLYSSIVSTYVCHILSPNNQDVNLNICECVTTYYLPNGKQSVQLKHILSKLHQMYFPICSALC